MKLLAIWFAILCPFSQSLAAQAFQDLATTQDGSTLYFSSPVRQQGTDQSFHSKIFQWDALNGVRVVAEVPNSGESNGCTTSNFYQLHSPQISMDGTVFAYTASRPISNGRYCSPAESNQAIIPRLARVQTVAGNIALTPNGRYAVTTSLAAAMNDFHIVTDMSTGQSSIVAGSFNGAARRLTSNATVLTPEPTAIILTDRTGETRLIQTKWAVDDAVIEQAGKTAAYSTHLSPSGPSRLSIIDIPSGSETELATGFAIANPVLAVDGSAVFFTDSFPGAPQLYTIGVGGANRRQLTQEKDGIAAIAVSGDGLVAFAATGGSRLIRIDTAAVSTTEIVPATPLITTAYRVYRPETTVAAVGSVMQLYGSGLASVRQATFCGRPLTPTLRFQVPWDLTEQTCLAIVQSDSPFEHAISLDVKQYDPQFAPVLAHENFQGFVSASNPASAGEVIIAYMTGLGPVDSSGALRSGFQCRFESLPADMPYAGLAPGLPGFYQLNLKVPNLHSSSVNLTCGWDAFSQASTSVWLGP